MSFALIGELPRHHYVWVDTRFTHKTPCGFVPAVWYGLVSYPGRMWGATVMLESGAVYRNLPIHAVAFREAPEGDWGPQYAQRWDCYGENFTTIEYRYLTGLDVLCRCGHDNKEVEGEYLFTAAPIGDGFSAYPEQAKEFTFAKLDNGWMTVQPTNCVLFRERSFTDSEMVFPKDLRRQTVICSCE